MPIKKDGKGNRWVEMELLVPGTPEQVWQAVATGPGNAAWFTRGEIEPRVGGAFRLDFGGGATTSGEVTTWDPPHAFSYVERDWEPGAPPVATEITITGRKGDRSVLRMVHSLFASEDAWDDQLEGFESGWPGFFEVLRVYLRHFAGSPAASFMKMTPSPDDALGTFRKLAHDLGLAGAIVGERRSLSGAPESWTGVVEHVFQNSTHRYVLVRLQDPDPGVVLVGTYEKRATSHGSAGPNSNVSVNRYCYGPDAKERAAVSEKRWQEWIDARYGAAVAPV
jgi:uncharacterized protein YndB with AHSA1/START domain